MSSLVFFNLGIISIDSFTISLFSRTANNAVRLNEYHYINTIMGNTMLVYTGVPVSYFRTSHDLQAS